MTGDRPDVVLDCNVFVQAAVRKQGPAAKVISLIDANRVTLHISKPILRELRSTLSYPELREKNPALTDSIVEEYISRIRFRGAMTRKIAHVFDYARDPDDEAYVDLAVAVRAPLLITRDNDLLCLMTDHSIEAKEFRQRFPFLTILDPVEFLRLFESQRP